MKLHIGDKAPDFEVNNQKGEPIKLSNYLGKKVVLYFYPKDQTPGCIAEACNLRDNYEHFLSKGYVIFGVSKDNEKSHQNFIKKQNIPFPLLADTELVIHNLYGTWAEKNMYGRTYMGTLRTTFVIDEHGVIENIIEKVKTKDHTNQILK